jgi:ABC-2 type transport system permease protein
MIATILRVTALSLARDRVALLLTFVLPVVFFSVFAVVFSGMDEVATRPVRVAVVVEGEGVFARALAEQLAREPGLVVIDPAALDRTAAVDAVRRGEAQVAVIVPAGAHPAVPGGTAAGPAVEIVSDRSNPLAVGVVRGVLQTAAISVGQRLLVARFGGLPGALPVPGASSVEALQVEVVDVLGAPERRPSIAFFAAGLGVMFLMFAVAGRSSILLEERESGILQRMLAAKVGLTRLLLGRWLYLVLLGTLQVTVMFLWAAVAFGLDLFTARHIAGFALVTAATAAAAAGFGLVLSSACRTRAQLNGVAVVVVLILAAVGGSLFPSFLMPEALRTVSRFAFNAWALAGYQKVFWYDVSVSELWPEMAVLAGWTVIFLVGARLLARRWEGA